MHISLFAYYKNLIFYFKHVPITFMNDSMHTNIILLVFFGNLYAILKIEKCSIICY